MYPAHDSLETVPLHEINNLLNVLRLDLPHSLQVYGAIQTFAEWKKNKTGRINLEIFVAYGSFKDGVLAIYKPTDLQYLVSMYCGSKDTSRLREALKSTSRIKWNLNEVQVTFEGLTENLVSVVDECLACKNMTTTMHSRSVKFWQTVERHMTYEISCPSDIQIGRVQSCHAKEIDENWAHRFKGSANHVAYLIERNFGLGIFLRDSKELVAWVLCNHFSGVGILHTKKDHRRKGYAQLLCHALSAQLIQLGILPQANVLVFNTPSKKVFRELQFDSDDCFFYIEATKSNSSTVYY